MLAPCLVGIEACATAHHWGREIAALGHEVRLMPAHYVKAYVKRGKNDATDAEAICEAVQQPTMRFVGLEPKTAWPAHAASNPGTASASAHDAGQCDLRPYGRVRDCDACWRTAAQGAAEEFAEAAEGAPSSSIFEPAESAAPRGDGVLWPCHGHA